MTAVALINQMSAIMQSITSLTGVPENTAISDQSAFLWSQTTHWACTNMPKSVFLSKANMAQNHTILCKQPLAEYYSTLYVLTGFTDIHIMSED